MILMIIIIIIIIIIFYNHLFRDPSVLYYLRSLEREVTEGSEHE